MRGISSEIKRIIFKEHLDSEKARKVQMYRELNKYCHKDQIVFTGSSLMEHFPISDLYTSHMTDSCNKQIYNRGISGCTTDEFLSWIEPMVLDLAPSKIFINIGTNDLNVRDDGLDWRNVLEANYGEILHTIIKELPDTQIYLMAYYPVNEDVLKSTPSNDSMPFRNRTNTMIHQANAIVRKLADEINNQLNTKALNYIDVNQGLTDENGQLKPEYTVEGLHIYANAYHIIYNNLKKYIK